MATLIDKLTEHEVGCIRRALRAMTPEMLARLDGQCFPARRKRPPHIPVRHLNARGQCILMCAFGMTEIVGSRAMERNLRSVLPGDTYKIAHVNDRGWLNTRAAVRELLSLADRPADNERVQRGETI